MTKSSRIMLVLVGVNLLIATAWVQLHAASAGVFSRRLKQKGFTILAELQKANIPFSSQGLVARGAFLQEQRAPWKVS